MFLILISAFQKSVKTKQKAVHLKDSSDYGSSVLRKLEELQEIEKYELHITKDSKENFPLLPICNNGNVSAKNQSLQTGHSTPYRVQIVPEVSAEPELSFIEGSPQPAVEEDMDRAVKRVRELFGVKISELDTDPTQLLFTDPSSSSTSLHQSELCDKLHSLSLCGAERLVLPQDLFVMPSIHLDWSELRQLREDDMSKSASCQQIHYDSYDIRCHQKNRRISVFQFILDFCHQSRPWDWHEIFVSQEIVCEKLGEGSFAEVFAVTLQERTIALKASILPVAGNVNVNGEKQKGFDEILPEIIIASSLSEMVKGSCVSAPNYLKLMRTCVLRGSYPEMFLTAWDEYASTHMSQNDRPNIFDDSQMFVMFVIERGGLSLEEFKFESFEQVESIFRQVVLSLGIAEKHMRFEHRDLHIGNVLIAPCDEDTLVYSFSTQYKVLLPSAHVKVKIIDFTNSRMEFRGFTIFMDVSTDDALFVGQGDPQFDVYRKMRELNGNDWSLFYPQSNIFWLEYLIGKLRAYKVNGRKMNRSMTKRLVKLQRIVRSHNSCLDICQDPSFLDYKC